MGKPDTFSQTFELCGVVLQAFGGVARNSIMNDPFYPLMGMTFAGWMGMRFAGQHKQFRNISAVISVIGSLGALCVA